MSVGTTLRATRTCVGQLLQIRVLERAALRSPRGLRQEVVRGRATPVEKAVPAEAAPGRGADGVAVPAAAEMPRRSPDNPDSPDSQKRLLPFIERVFSHRSGYSSKLSKAHDLDGSIRIRNYSSFAGRRFFHISPSH